MPPLSPSVVIAHRGASGLRPEHTLAAYELAIAQGADAIEPDLVPTADGVPVVRHENEIGETTDVASRPQFASRRATRLVEGRVVSGWFAEDFTLAELKTLRARERLPGQRPESAAHDGRYEVLTFAELLAFAKQRGVAVHAEIKHSSHFAALGLPLEPAVLADLHRIGWNAADAPVVLQSFEVANLRRLRALTPVRLIQLIEAAGAPACSGAQSYAAMATPAGLAEVARYAWGIGPNKALLWDGDAPTSLVADAHRAGLRVFPWTYRAENAFLPVRHRRPGAHGDLAGEIAAAIAQGIDGFFTDFPAIGAEVVRSVA